jgi:hypothetical protein
MEGTEIIADDGLHDVMVNIFVAELSSSVSPMVVINILSEYCKATLGMIVRVPVDGSKFT